MSTKKVALITGATSGIGKELAKCFIINGYSIIIVGRDQVALQKTAKEFKKTYGADVTTINVDLSVPDAAEKVFAELKGRTVDVLVNNAGFAISGLFHENSVGTIIGCLRTNIESLTHLTRLLLPQMIDRRTGRILNVASTAAFAPGPQMAVYYATKAYVLSFSEGIRYELKGTGVTISTLCPGPTDTNFAKKGHVETTPMFNKKSKMMKPEDVACIAYNRLMDGDAIIVPGFTNKLTAVMARFVPRAIALKVANKGNTANES
jgi:short-subunit dehydrogenase